MMKFGRKPGFPSRGMFRPVPSGRAAANVAEDILEFLRDGELHEPREIANAVNLSEEDTKKVLDFLIQSGLVTKGVRITELGYDFLELPI
jgi:predicted transcriptional regulator